MVSWTKEVFVEGVKESRGDAARGGFVGGVGGWSGRLTSPGVSINTLSGAEGVDGMLSSGAGLNLWVEGEGEEQR